MRRAREATEFFAVVAISDYQQRFQAQATQLPSCPLLARRYDVTCLYLKATSFVAVCLASKIP